MIINVDFSRSKQHFFVKQPVSGTVYCIHRQIEIDRHQRILSCSQCGKVIDAYDYVENLATKETRLFNDIKQLQQDVQELTMHRDKLKAQVSRLKSEHKKAVDPYKAPIAKPSVLTPGDRQSCLSQIKQTLADKS